MRKIVIEELMRAGAGMIFWMAGLYGLDYIGVIAISAGQSLAISAGISTVMFSALVVLRTRTGWKLQVPRFRYMLILLLVVGIPVFTWRMLEGKVMRAAVFAIVMVLVGVLVFITMRKRGLKW